MVVVDLDQCDRPRDAPTLVWVEGKLNLTHQRQSASIKGHGIVGDLRTAVLAALKGAVNFPCWPRFDSPSVFAFLLDQAKDGRFGPAPEPGQHTFDLLAEFGIEGEALNELATNGVLG